MKYCILLLLLIFNAGEVLTQHRGDNWCFGDSSIISFVNGQANVMPYSGVISIEASASISDNNGNLLFYTGGDNQLSNYSTVWNNLHHLMQNGDSLNCDNSATNGIIIIPFINDSNKYYIFTSGLGYCSTGACGLYYSIVDMSMNGGLGAVTAKNILLTSFIMAEKLAAVKHGNGRDWWIVSHEAVGANYYIFLIQDSGIALTPIIQPIGKQYFYTPSPSQAGGFGEIVYSSNGKKMVSVSSQMIDYFEFDRCTGNLSGYQDLSGSVNYLEYYGTSFSPENAFLYVSTSNYYGNSSAPGHGEIYQFNLDSVNILPSKQLIYTEWDSLITFGQHQLAQDGKIYISMTKRSFPNHISDSTSMFLNTISSPDVAGIGCNFQRYTLYLNGNRALWGLPNIPNYNLGKMSGSICDTIVQLDEVLETHSGPLTISPNPAEDFFWLSFNLSQHLGNSELVIYNILGEIVERKTLYNHSKTSKIDCSTFSTGIYYLSIISNQQRVASAKFVKE